jgi:DNA-3-methyladenine glycosylase
VYLCYGIHWMLNLICERKGVPTGVLIRSCEIIDGTEVVLARRRATRVTHALLAGPGKVAQALALDGSSSGADLCAPDAALRLHKGVRADVVSGPRVGIDYADTRDQRAPRRFALKGSRAVTSRDTLALAR